MGIGTLEDERKNQVVVSVKDLIVRYRSKTAVSNLSFTISPGECLGLLGANGAGKTSTVKALLGLVRPTRGLVKIFGCAPGSIKALGSLGYAPEEGVPSEHLSGKEYLTFVAQMRAPLSKSAAQDISEKLLVDFELSKDKRVGDYSKGMRRRLVLAQAFMGSPKLVILDEPLNGLDPLMIVKLREYILNYREKGGAVLYSSHILSEVERTCPHVLILRDGEAVTSLAMPELLEEFGSVEGAFTKRARELI